MGPVERLVEILTIPSAIKIQLLKDVERLAQQYVSPVSAISHSMPSTM